MDTGKFRHRFSLRVQFHEVDLLGVCNNAVYFNYFETARIEYLRAIGQYRDIADMQSREKFYLIAHNDCDYMEPAFFDDELTVYTRIKLIKNSSFTYEHIVESLKTGRVIAHGHGVLVHIDRNSRKSIPLSEEFYKAVLNYELKGSVIIERKSI